jgi:hypothetical protein
MSIHWGSLFAVFVTSLGATVAVVALVATALLGLSARAPQLALPAAGPRRRALSPRAGTAVAAACLGVAAAIVLVGLWTMIVR